MGERIGVYVCDCGSNIKSALDTEDVARSASQLGDVVAAKTHSLLCARHGQEFLMREIGESRLSRVVIAACSPKEHEATFMDALESSGLNPYMMQMANIREQVAWVTPDKARATEKAKRAVAAAHSRVRLHEPLRKTEVDINPDVLVVGAGVGGLNAALIAAQKGRKVYLVERTPCIGGHVTMTEEVFPTLECSTCMMEPEIQDVMHHQNIEVLTNAEVIDVIGFNGNFTAMVRERASFVDRESCVGCDECYKACPVRVSDEFNGGLGTRGAIFLPYPGAIPNVATIDKGNCLRSKGEDCRLCAEACSFGAVKYDDEDRIQAIKVGAIVLAIGAASFDPRKAPESGYGRYENVLTLREFERMLNSTGPTKGRILLRNGKTPRSVGIIYCVGSRSKRYHSYCSGDCCMYSLLFTHSIRKQIPGAKVFNIHSDLCLPGKGYSDFYERVRGDGIFIRAAGPDATTVSSEKGRLVMRCRDAAGKMRRISVDMVILATATVPHSDAPAVAELFGIPLDEYGFFKERHCKLCPVSTTTDGVFIVGPAQGPMELQHSVAQGAAAGGHILSSLVPGGKIEIDPMVAEIDSDLCSGCKVCIGMCPYRAIAFDDIDKVAEVNGVLCKGCGTCVASCPSGAARGKHFTSEEILAEVSEALR